jgi:hypothetical protein
MVSIDFGRTRCDHCDRDFMIVNGVPMTVRQYRESSKVQ